MLRLNIPLRSLRESKDDSTSVMYREKLGAVWAYATLNNAPFQMVDPLNPPKLPPASYLQDAREA